MSALPATKVPGRKLGVHSRRRWSPGLLASQAKALAGHSLGKRGQDLDKFLRAVVDACASNVAVLDEFGSILYASKAWRLFARANSPGTRQQNSSPYFFDYFRRIIGSSGPEAATLGDDIQRILVGEEKEFHRQYCYYGPNEPRHIVSHAARLNLPGSAFRVLVAHDEVVIAKEALRKSEERLSQLLASTKILVWEAEPETWRFTHVSKQAVEILGYPIAQWYEPGFLASHIHRDDRKRALSICQNQAELADHYDLTFRVHASDGRIVWLQNLVSFTHENGKSPKMSGFMIDISERKRAEEALEELGGRLIAAQEEERRRVARELHDDLNQRMALLSIELEQLAEGTDKSPSLRGSIRKVQKQAQEISADIHRISYKLHPAKLDHLGLAPAVKSLCKELSESRDLSIELKQAGFPATLPRDVTLCAFRIVQEALGNSVKHSGAEVIQVVLEKTNAVLRLAVSDNGCGFDMESDAMKKGLGFVSMRERLHLVGGEIQIESRKQRGTYIKASIPLNRDSDSATS